MKNTSRTRMLLVGAVVGLGTVVGAGAAGAATPNPYPGTPSTLPPAEALAETLERPVALSAAAEGATAEAPTAQSNVDVLPFTGGDAAGLAAIGALAVAAGAAITVGRRRTAAA